MSEDLQYAACSVCGHAYRPGVEDSIAGHRVATGHAPTPARERPNLSHLLIVAARRIGELEDVVDGLDGLITTWKKAPAVDPVDGPGLGRAAEMLRDYLARPPVHAQPDVEEEPRG